MLSQDRHSHPCWLFQLLPVLWAPKVLQPLHCCVGCPHCLHCLSSPTISSLAESWLPRLNCVMSSNLFCLPSIISLTTWPWNLLSTSLHVFLLPSSHRARHWADTWWFSFICSFLEPSRARSERPYGEMVKSVVVWVQIQLCHLLSVWPVCLWTNCFSFLGFCWSNLASMQRCEKCMSWWCQKTSSYSYDGSLTWVCSPRTVLGDSCFFPGVLGHENSEEGLPKGLVGDLSGISIRHSAEGWSKVQGLEVGCPAPAIPPAFQGCAYSGGRKHARQLWETTSPARKQSLCPPKGGQNRTQAKDKRFTEWELVRALARWGLLQRAWPPSGDWGLHPEEDSSSLHALGESKTWPLPFLVAEDWEGQCPRSTLPASWHQAGSQPHCLPRTSRVLTLFLSKPTSN